MLDSPTAVIPLVPGPPPRRRWVVVMKWLVAVLVLAVLAAGAAVVISRHRASGRPAAPAAAAVVTAKLQRRDLSTTESLAGAIGYGPARPLTGHTAATVTWLPAAGATIKRGRQLFRADDQPVVLFYGNMPLYRPIAGPNLVGRDVRIVADNLAALGYRTGHRLTEGDRVPVTPQSKAPSVRVRAGEEVLTTGLIAAIKRWQDDLGRPVTGQIAVGDVEVQAGAVRVDSVAGPTGSPADAPLMSVTSTRKVVTVLAEAADAAALKPGRPVTVTLPDDRTVKARIVTIGRTLAVEEGATGDSPPKLTVSVTVDDPKTIAALDAADVQVNVAGRTAEHVLAAPVEALIALAEGGYAVQGPAGLVAVRTGMFADGWVELTGPGLAEGTAVVVAS